MQDESRTLSQGGFILFIWVILFAFGLSVWLKVWFDLNLIYQPREPACVLCAKQLIKYIFTVSPKLAEEAPGLALGRNRQVLVMYFLNSSPTNITFYRPLFFPLISAILAIPAVFLVYGFNADLPRIAIVSFLVGMVADVVLRQVQERANNFVKGILGAN